MQQAKYRALARFVEQDIRNRRIMIVYDEL